MPRLAVALIAFLALTVSLHAAGKKTAPTPADTWLSPNGLFRVHLARTTSAEGLTQAEVTLTDAKSGATLLELEGPGGSWIDGTRVLWAPDSKRFVYVTSTRRGNWCDYVIHHGDQWENAPWPVMPVLEYHGPHRESKTVLAAWNPIRWLKPNVFLVENAVEDADGNSAKMRVTLTFDADNQITARPAGR